MRKLGFTLTWHKKNAVSQLWNYIAFQLNQKVHFGSCTALQKLKTKLNCAFCAALSLLERSLRFVAMRF